MYFGYCVCVLISSFILNTVPYATSYSCKSSSDCQVEGAVCENNVCTCPPDYISNSIYTQCLPIAYGLGAPCTDNLQCSATLMSGGFCHNNYCDCEAGYHYFLGYCWKTSGLQEKCYTNENCFVDQNFESAVCNSNKVCSCKEGYYQREYSSCRLKSLKPGDPCGILLDCQFPHSTCTWNHACAVADETNDIKLISKIARNERSSQSIIGVISNDVIYKIGDKCDKTSACPLNSKCSAGGICKCLPGFYTLDNIGCFPEIGAKCSVDVDCKGRNTFCKNKDHCSCTEGHVISMDRRSCDKLSRYLGWSCLRDAWCSYFGPNSICVNKRCVCSNTTHYVPEQMYCWTTINAGSKCQSSLDCGSSGMTCEKEICTCPKDTHPSSSATECRPNSLYGQNCTETIDCLFPNSLCNTTIGKCSCGSDYIFDGTSCKSGIGGPCNVANVCSLANSECADSGKCACTKGFVPNGNRSKCLPRLMEIDGACEDSSQCSELNARCFDGKCQCNEGHHYVKGWKCFKSVSIGERCSRNGECVSPHASCLKYICSCDRGFVNSDSQLCSGSMSGASFWNSGLLIVTLVLTLSWISSLDTSRIVISTTN